MNEEFVIRYTSPTPERDNPIVLTARYNATMQKWESTALIGNFATRKQAEEVCNRIGEFLSFYYSADVEQMEGEKT